MTGAGLRHHALGVLALVAASASPCLASGQPVSRSPAGDATKEAVIDYCLNISDRAAEARMARHTQALKELEAKLDTKIQELEKRRGEVEAAVTKQKEMLTAAEAGLVEIYASMDPDAAADQMSKLDPKLASSVLRQLKPRQAGGILNEMQAEQAAQLIRIIAAAAETEEKSSE